MNFSEYRSLINSYLSGVITESYPYNFTKSMRYSLLNGGKRLRPLIILSEGVMFDIEINAILPFAAAVEMIHTYSLIHDDLPDMDDDDLRRGKATNHKVFGGANAILAGDGLLTHSFFVISQLKKWFSSESVIKLIELTARYAGLEGMAAGQSADINKEILDHSKRKTIDFIHSHKTAKIIMLCFEGPALLAGLPQNSIKKLQRAASQIGLAFQIQDDILDVTPGTEKAGKNTKSDEKTGKWTYLSFLTTEQAHQKVERLFDESYMILAGFRKSAQILELLDIIREREK